MAVVTATPNDDFCVNDLDRIKSNTKKYAKKSINEAFCDAYSIKLKNVRVVNPVTLEMGQVYTGKVKEINKSGVILEVPGVSEIIFANDNFYGQEKFKHYLETTDGEVMFEVRSFSNVHGQYNVSIKNAYYKYWLEHFDYGAMRTVRLDRLVRGGYIGSMLIDSLEPLSDNVYTQPIFVPGSQIVLNIESDFARWVGQYVDVLSDSFSEYRIDGVMTNVLLCSRKKLLQYNGMLEMYKLVESTKADDKAKKPRAVIEGKVSGVIKSQKKCGIFVELEERPITGFLEVSSYDLVNYKPGQPVKVKVKEFEVAKGRPGFEITNSGKIKRCNTRVVFEFA